MTALTHTQLQTFRHLLQQREQQLRQELAAAHQEQEQQAEDAEDMPPEPDANQTHETADREVRYDYIRKILEAVGQSGVGNVTFSVVDKDPKAASPT
jgi:RNA polymerase-binding transcription factor DksA